MPGFKGKLNIYTCRECRGHVVTVDKDDGTTPFLIGCHSTPGCKGLMQSSMYRVYDQTMKPEFEWYRPSDEETRKMPPSTQEHIAMGGLVMRKIQEEEK